MIVSENERKLIEKDFEEVRLTAQHKAEELFNVLNQCTEDEAFCLKYLYTVMPLQDLASYDGELFLKFVRQALRVRTLMPWREALKGEMFLNYVLQYRISNESIEYYKDTFFDEIYPRIQGKSMYEAAVIINYWCFEKATYQNTDRRISSPLTTISNGYGRCSEESIFCVAAFRSVGIPARQVYTPSWGVSDGRHAWVEVWLDGEWYFLGACEPEPLLNTGWFKHPASRCMLIASDVFSKSVQGEVATYQADNITGINVLEHYARVKEIQVVVVDEVGNGVSHANVRFEIINYAQYFPLVELQTDCQGKASFVTGYGDLLIYVYKDGVATSQQMDVRLNDTITIVLKDNLRTHGKVETMTLVPPTGSETNENKVSEALQVQYEAETTYAANTRQAFVDTFYLGDKALLWAEKFGVYQQAVARHLESARGNYKEIQAFFDDQQTLHLTAYKIKMLDTMVAKDLSDTSSDILKEHLLYGLVYKDEYEEAIFLEGILAPSIALEKISAYRKSLKEMFTKEEIEEFKANPTSAYAYIKHTIRTQTSNPDMYLHAQPVGLMKLRVGDIYSQKILFVALCRTFGIPAKLNQTEDSISYYQNNEWVRIGIGEKHGNGVKDSRLTLHQIDDTTPQYMKTYTIGKWDHGVYKTLYLETGEWVDGKVTYVVEAGAYRITTVNREESGTVHANMYYVDIAQDQEVEVLIEIKK